MMRFKTTIKLVLEGPPPRPLPNVRVQLWDRDRITRDDLLGSAVTDEDGEAVIRFKETDFYDLDERLGGDMPDLYVVVLDRQGRKVLSTRSRVIPNVHRERMTVVVPRQLALQHGLILSPPLEGGIEPWIPGRG